MFGDSGAEVIVSGQELIMLNNALNEVCNGIDIHDSEFQTRLGFERSELAALLDEMHRLLERPRLTHSPLP